MAIAMAPWIEWLIQTIPILYALGFFAAEVPLAWGAAGLVTGLFMCSIGYGVLEVFAYGAVGLHMLFWATLGSVLSYGSHYKSLLEWNRTGVQPTEVTPVAAPGQPGAPSHPANCVFVGTVHDARSMSDVIEGAKVRIVGGEGYETMTDNAGRYRLEVPVETWFWRDKVSLEADHPSYHYPNHSVERKVKTVQYRIDFPMDRLVSASVARGQIKVTFADENGKVVTNIVSPGGWWAAHIEPISGSPLTFDIPSGKRVATEEDDKVELFDETIHPGKLIMKVTRSTPRSQGEILYQTPKHVFVRGRVPSKYADGTPIPMNTQLKVELVLHINVT